VETKSNGNGNGDYRQEFGKLVHDSNSHMRREFTGMLESLKELLLAKMAGADALLDEKLNDILSRLAVRDIQRADDRRALETSILTSIQALKDSILATNTYNDKAIAKSEITFKEALASLERNADSKTAVLAENVGSLKERLDRGEGSEYGVQRMRQNTSMTIGNVLGIIGGVIGVLTFVLSIAIVYASAHSTTQQAATALSSLTPAPGQATADANSRRIDDLIERFNSLSARLNLTTPAPKVPGQQ
jgi:hypothetical protein